MSTIGTSLGAYSNSASLLDYLNEETDSTVNASSKEAIFANASSLTASKKLSNAYGGGINSATGKAALNRALSELQGLTTGAITFARINEYQGMLEDKFAVTLQIEMVKKGADPEQEFAITMNSDGTIQVDCSDVTTKALVEKYLADNPKVCEEFGYIQALGNLDRARQSAVWTGTKDAKAAIVAESIEVMFSDTLSSGLMDYSALTAQFYGTDNTDVKFYTGLNFTV